MQIKVRIRYRDGVFSMERYSAVHAAAGLSYAVVSPDDWEDYCQHCNRCRHWYEFLRERSNEQFDREHR